MFSLQSASRKRDVWKVLHNFNTSSNFLPHPNLVPHLCTVKTASVPSHRKTGGTNFSLKDCNWKFISTQTGVVN